MPTTKKLKIIHTEASPHWGGQEIRIFEEMKWFRDQGHEMILIAPINGTLLKRCKEDGFKVISIYFTKPKTLLNIFKMMWIIWREKPDVIATHSSTDSWAGLFASTICKVKKRVRYRHVSTPVKPNLLNRLQYKLLANLILTTGECTRKPLIINFRLNRNKVLSVPTPVKKIACPLTKEKAKKELCKELLIDEDSLIIGQISVFRGWKGHRFLIDSFTEIACKFNELHLVLIGDGPLLNQMKEHAASTPHANKIHFLGHKPDPLTYYKGLDVCVLVSLKNEGIPQALLQAMSVQTPVLGTSVGGIPEIISHNRTGILIEPNNKKELIEGVGKLIKEVGLKKKLCRSAYEMSTDFCWKNIGRQIEDLFSFTSNSTISSIPKSSSRIAKKNIVLIAHHSSWGAASNFREMFTFSKEFNSIEINHDTGGKTEYNFGEGKAGTSITIDEISSVKNLFKDPDTILFVFDYLGIKLLSRICKNLNLCCGSFPVNILWSGNPFIKNRKFCLNWASKFNAREYAMLDLLRLCENALPLMQPYDLKKFDLLLSNQPKRDQSHKVRICHSPGHKGNSDEKGTKIIQKVISELMLEFDNIEYVLLGGKSWMDNAECLEVKSSCNIFIDKVGVNSAGGIGKSGIESICLGIPTISSVHKTRFQGRYEQLKVISSNTHEELLNTLRKLISDPNYYKRCVSETFATRDLFNYSNTHDYLRTNMNQ